MDETQVNKQTGWSANNALRKSIMGATIEPILDGPTKGMLHGFVIPLNT